jgi:hypothetical protein
MSKKGVVFHCKEETLMKAIAMIIQISSHFDSSIFIEKDGRRARKTDANSLPISRVSSGDCVITEKSNNVTPLLSVNLHHGLPQLKSGRVKSATFANT